MTPSHRPTLAVVGSINADLMVKVDRHPRPGETLLGTGGDVLAGGKGANQAVAAALQGAAVTFVGAVGEDAYAAPALAYLRSAGVDLTHVTEVGATTGLAVITVAADGENSIIVIPGANSRVDAAYVRAHRQAVESADILLLQGEIPSTGFAETVRLAQDSGTRVVINLAPVVEVDRQALLSADPIIVNEHEAGGVLTQLGAPVPGEPREIVQALLAAGFASAVMTLGARGALVGQEDQITHVASPAVPVVDTTGAGDAFAGALVAKLLGGTSLADAAAHATRVGAFAVQARGAQPSYPGQADPLPGGS